MCVEKFLEQEIHLLLITFVANMCREILGTRNTPDATQTKRKLQGGVQEDRSQALFGPEK